MSVKVIADFWLCDPKGEPYISMHMSSDWSAPITPKLELWFYKDHCFASPGSVINYHPRELDSVPYMHESYDAMYIARIFLHEDGRCTMESGAYLDLIPDGSCVRVYPDHFRIVEPDGRFRGVPIQRAQAPNLSKGVHLIVSEYGLDDAYSEWHVDVSISSALQMMQRNVVDSKFFMGFHPGYGYDPKKTWPCRVTALDLLELAAQ